MGKRCISELNKKSATPGTEKSKNTVINYLLSEDGHMLRQMKLEEEQEQQEQAKSEISAKLYKEADFTKPPSDFMYIFEDKNENDSRLNSRRMSSRSIVSTEQLKDSELQRRQVRGEKDLPKHIMTRILNGSNLALDSHSTRTIDDLKTPQLSSRSKSLKYQGYNINLTINEEDERAAKQKSRLLKSGMSFYLNNEYEIKVEYNLSNLALLAVEFCSQN